MPDGDAVGEARRRELVQERGADALNPQWWLTYGKGRCHGCGNWVQGDPVAYCYEERRCLCEVCWDREGISPKPSKRWLRATEPAQPTTFASPTEAKREAINHELSARHTQAQLAQWGVKWPPQKGWKKALRKKWLKDPTWTRPSLNDESPASS